MCPFLPVPFLLAITVRGHYGHQRCLSCMHFWGLSQPIQSKYLPALHGGRTLELKDCPFLHQDNSKLRMAENIKFKPHIITASAYTGKEPDDVKPCIRVAFSFITIGWRWVWPAIHVVQLRTYVLQNCITKVRECDSTYNSIYTTDTITAMALSAESY